VLGAGGLGRAIARCLVEGGENVVLIDSNQFACREAEDQGFRVLHGSALQERTLLLAGADGRYGCIGVTPNEEVNLLAVGNAMEEYDIPSGWVALRKGHVSIRPDMVEERGARLLFGAARSVDFWTIRLERGTARVETWVYVEPDGDLETSPSEMAATGELEVLPVAWRRKDRVRPVDERTAFRKDDVLFAVVFQERRDRAVAWLEERGWAPVDAGAVPREEKPEVSPG